MIRKRQSVVNSLVLGLGVIWMLAVEAHADIARFVGDYTGSAEVIEIDGTAIQRDMNVSIAKEDDGFTVDWTSTTYKSDGRAKEKSYSVDFRASDRDGVFSAAMKRNVFGHTVPLDPMAGEPYIWARIDGDTLTVFSLFVDDDGGYELQQFDRTLADGGLTLDYQSVHNGQIRRVVSTFLKRN